MDTTATLIGRTRLLADLAQACAATLNSRGGLLLLAGEAGVGKTRLASEALADVSMLVLNPLAAPADAPAYGPIVGALRAFRRVEADEGPFAGPLAAYLRRLLPELGEPPAEGDRTTLFEAVCAAFEGMVKRQPVIVFLDDLHEADHATFELLPHLARRLENLPLLILAAYRTDELPRDHPLRGMRAALRRAGQLRELVVEPLGPDETAELARHVLGSPPSRELAALLYERTQGLPLFVEELAATLAAHARLSDEGGALGIADAQALLPVPETVRDLVLLAVARLDDTARAALEVAAVAGVSFDLDLVTKLGGGELALAQPFTLGLLRETDTTTGAFRHPLIRDAIYSDIPWPRRRALHRQLGQRLERLGAPPQQLVEHWLGARELERARQALLSSARAAARVHAYRDAAAAIRRALELWPENDAEPERILALEDLGECAQLSGNLPDAVSAWRQVADAHQSTGQLRELAGVQRRLAGVFELQGVWEAALSAREAAAAAFAASHQPGEAAAERLVAATHLRSAASFGPALELLAIARGEAIVAGRLDLHARILGLGGNVYVRQGQREVGLEQVRAGLALALEHNLSGPAAEVYQRLADAHEHSGDYTAARQTYMTAAAFCEMNGATATAQLCLACMTAVLRQTGEWDRCEQVCLQVQASSDASLHARAAALGMLGSIYAHRGDASRARPLLLEAARIAQHIELAAMQLLSAWGLAIADDVKGDASRASERCREILARWERTEERHYVVAALRWSSTLFASHHNVSDTQACVSALARIVAATSETEAVAALGHALGEATWLSGDAAAAVSHFEQALARYEGLGLPFESAHTAFRAGGALLAVGQREQGIERLTRAYRTAWTLGARPLAAACARELERAGEPVVQRLSRRAADLISTEVRVAGLTEREREVAQLVAQGCTNREIAEHLVISKRTTENHIQRILNRLNLHSRAQIAAWAVQHGVSPASPR